MGRRGFFEALESRHLLSITLPTIPNVTLPAGTTMYIPLSGSDAGQTVKYAVTASDYSQLTPVMMPESNKTLQLNLDVNGTTETMDFQLLDNLSPATTAAIEALVQSGFYDGLEIYRNAPDGTNTFVLQGGNDPPDPSNPDNVLPIKTDQSPMAEEFNPNLEYTSAGLLGMARTSDPGTSSTEFFITGEPTRSLDFSYTIFGVQTSGFDVFNTIAAMPDQTSSEYLQTPVTITSASIISDNQDGVLQISAPTGATGTVTVTVTASDGTNTPVTQSFTVTMATDDSSNPANPFAAVIPATPTALSFTPAGGGSAAATNLNNSTSGSALQFLVSGVTAGTNVEILCDGNVIGSAPATSASVTVPTDGTTTITDGVHTFTAIEIAPNQTVSVTESGSTTPLSKTADVPSFNSPAVQLTVDTVAPQFNYFPATVNAVVNVTDTCQVSVSEGTSTGVTYTLTQSPAGLTIDPNTGLITWAPGQSQVGTSPVTVQATDLAGNTASQQFSVNVLASNAAPVLTTTTPSLGTTDENTATTIALSTFINSTIGTIVTDGDVGNPLGGIALTDTTGSGTWAYSLDGITFTNVGTVAASSALLLPYDAVLRYTPNSISGGTATIAYHAWDTTGGAAAGRADLTQTDATGSSTPYSIAGDVATLTVTDVNDAPVLTPAAPSLGSIDVHAAKTFALTTIINNGTGTTGITDVDPDAVIGGIALTGTTGSGDWAYSLDGTTFTDIGTVSATSSLLLPSTASLQYTPTGTSGETATIVYCAWDTTSGTSTTKVDTSSNGGSTAFSAATDTATLTVTSNTAPVLTAANPSLGSIAINATTTIALVTFINDGTGTTTITDADSGAVVGGIALTGVSGGGTWAYSLDGTTFTNVGTVSATAALLLPNTAELRYTAGANSETATITYCAWDTYTGTAGTTADTTTNGGLTAFSTASDTAKLSVGVCSISGFVYVNVDNDGLMTKNGQTHTVLENVLVKLYDDTSGAEINEVVTGSDGSYHFTDLGAGTYRVAESQPSNYLDGKETLGTIGGASQGTVGADQFTLTLAASDTATGYNFGELGLKPSLISLSMSLASSPAFLAVADVGMAATPVTSLACTITANDGVINAAKATSTGFTFANAHVGATFQYTITSSGGGTPITSTGAITSATQQMTGIDVSSLPDGTLTYTVTLTSADGLTGPAATATATLDQTAPSGYSITPNDANLDATTAASTGFTFTSAEVNDTYSYTITSDGSTTATVTGNGTITSATQVVGNIDVSSLPDGTLTYDVTLTDPAGNVGSAAPATAELDRVAPAGYTITANDSLIGPSDEASTSFTINNAEAFTNYNYTITSSGSTTASVTGSGSLTLTTQTISNVDVSSLPDGTLTFSVTLTDAAGNVGAAATTTATLDTTAPTGYSITVDQPLIGAAAATSTSFTFADAEYTPGATTTYNYTVASSAGGAAITGSGTLTSATQQVTGINVLSLPEGTLTYSVYLTDAAGNAGTPFSATATLDKTPPSGYSISVDQDPINAATATATSFTFDNAEITAGTTYNYTVTSDNGGTPVSGSGTITSATQQITNIDVSGLHDGTLTYTVYLTDAAGNVGNSFSTTVTLDATPPSGYSIAVDQDPIGAATAASSSFTFADAEISAGTTYHYTVTSSNGGTPVSGSGSISSAAQQITNIDVSGLHDGTLSYTVYLTDAAGNVGNLVTRTVTLDTTPPSGYSISVDQKTIDASTATAVSFTFANAEFTAGTTYSYTVTSSGGGSLPAATGPVTSATQQVTDIDVSSLSPGTLTFTVTLIDAAGNVGDPFTDNSATLS